jgi:hypothetical protein
MNRLRHHHATISAAAEEMQEVKILSNSFASMMPAPPIATIWVRGTRPSHSSSTEMPTRLPTT